MYSIHFPLWSGVCGPGATRRTGMVKKDVSRRLWRNAESDMVFILI